MGEYRELFQAVETPVQVGVRPYANKVLVQVEEIKEAGKIVIPESVKHAHEMQREVGVIVAMGPCCFLELGGPEAAGVSVGDRAIFVRHGGKLMQDISEGGRTLRLINDADLIAAME